ncbi:MAG: helix-turn-helix transcriptional regulator, partial [Actinomycetota bacterium]
VEQPLLGPLYSAILERAPITFDYQPAEGEERTRSLEPYGLVHKRGNWYVVGRDVEREDVRAFRVSRITSGITTGTSTFEIPRGFDAAAHLGGEPYEVGPGSPAAVRVLFAPSLSWWAEQNIPDAPRVARDDGSVEVEIPVANIDALIAWAISLGPEVEILSPEAARGALVDHLAPFLEPA